MPHFYTHQNTPMNRVSTHIKQALKDVYPPEELKSLVMMIWCDLLGKDALDIYLGKDTNLSTTEHQQLENILQRMTQHEPVQYVRGVANFCGYTFAVAPGVLIPRHETEELVELIVKENTLQSPRILDIGTGSGCIAISLSLLLSDARVTAWDISEQALCIASKNNKTLNGNVFFEKQDALGILLTETIGKYDIVVSNPPYITNSEKKEMERNVLDWEPHLALFVPDEDPLLFYRQIALHARKLLCEGGRLYFEINRAYGVETVEMLYEMGYRAGRIIKDISGNDRIVTALT